MYPFQRISSMYRTGVHGTLILETGQNGSTVSRASTICSIRKSTRSEAQLLIQQVQIANAIQSSIWCGLQSKRVSHIESRLLGGARMP